MTNALTLERHVTGTCEGSGTSATRTRRTVPLAGASDRCAGPRTRLSPAACRRGGGGGWGHEGAVRAGPGGQPPGPARAAEGASGTAISRSDVSTSPRAQGKTRPIGISAFEDKVVQDAVREVLEAIYEQDFLDCSYGFRPGRSAHDAVRTLNRIVDRGEVRWIFEADIVSFFDSLDRTELKKMLEVRVADGSLLRLIGKCLHVGVLDGEALSEPELGTAQGSVLSPLLGNVYLHYVLDLWFETEVKPRLRGKATLIRYCDDFIIGFEREDDARRVMAVLEKRLGRFGLTLHPDKTRLLPFWRPPQAQQSGKGPATFDFLGFTFYWSANPQGSLADGVQDTAGEPETGQAGHLRLVSTPSASAGQGAARRAQSTLARPLQLLRRQWQLSESAATRRSDEAGLVQVAVPSQPAQASQLGEVHAICSDGGLFPAHGSRSGSGAASHESHRRKSRMVEISLSGSGEGPGWVTSPTYSISFVPRTLAACNATLVRWLIVSRSCSATAARI